MITKRILQKVKRKIYQVIFGNFNVPVGNDYFGKKAEIYEATRASSIFWRNENRFLEKTILKLTKEKDITTVLDLPCGTGRFYEFYEDCNIAYIGGDFSDDMLNLANQAIKRPNLGQNLKMISTKIPLYNNSVDIVVCFRFLQWIIPLKEVKATLIEFHRVTRKFCLIELSVGRHRKRNKSLNENLTMWDNFNLDEITLLLREVGFEIKDFEFLYDDEENPNMYGFLCLKR